MSELHLCWRGRLAYGPTLDAQRRYRDAVCAGQAPEALWLLEHEPVITLGRRAAEGVDEAGARAAGFEVHATERGGLATCHEPGQLVGYLFVDARRWGVRRLVDAVEEGLIGWVEGAGVPAGRREGHPGVWVRGAEPPAKLGAIGLHVGSGVTMHGFALNLHNDRRGFGFIVPCGIRDAAVATVAERRGEGRAEPLEPVVVARAVGEAVARALGRTPRWGEGAGASLVGASGPGG